MTVVVPVKQQHVPALAELFTEMDHFYGDTPPSRDFQEHGITAALFSNPPAAYALVALDDQKLVGFAAYSFLWPAAGVSRSLYLKELYVLEAHRKAGVGKLLMDEIFVAAKQHQCSRVEWATDEFNINAQKFYKLLRHEPLGGKIHYRVTLEP